MNEAAKTLPSDTEVLQQIIKNQQAVILSLQAQLAALKRNRFGRSSEKLDTKIEQLELMLDEMAYLGVDVDISEQEETASPETPKPKPARQRLPKDLPAKK